MKRIRKRLPALLLAILLCLNLLPVTAGAAQVKTDISSITLNIDLPAASAEPDNDVQAGKDDIFSVESYSGCTWYQVSGPGETETIKGLKEGDTFADNSWYLVELYLIAGYGYQFTDKTTVDVSGAARTAIEPSEGGEKAWALVWFRVGGEPSQTGTISSIAITGVPIPAAGQTADEAYGASWENITRPDGIERCQLVSYDLWDSGNSGDSKWRSPWYTGNEKFSTEKTYRVVFNLYAADGYTFNESITSVTVNSQTAYILEQGKGYAQVMLMFTPGESAATYRGYVEISYAEVISAVWPVEGMTIPKDQRNFTVSSEYYTLTVAKWQRNVGVGADSYWSDLTGDHQADSIFLQTQYRIYAEVSVVVPWALFNEGVTGSINGAAGTYGTVEDDGKTCVLTREVAVYDAVYAYPVDSTSERDYAGVPLSINTPRAGVEATVGYYGKKDAWEGVDGLSKCYTDWYEVPRVGSTYTLKRLIGASESEGTSGDHFEAGKVYLFQVQFRSERYYSDGELITFRENFGVQGFYDLETGAVITPALTEQTVNDRHRKEYNFWFTTGDAEEQKVTEVAVTGPTLNSPEDLDELTGSYGLLTNDALKKFTCDQLTATFGYAYENDDGSWIVSLTLEVNSGYYLGLQQNISATYNGDAVPFQVDSWDPYDIGYITITLIAGQPVSVQKAGETNTTEYDTLEAAVQALDNDSGTITLRRSYTLEKDSAVDITVPGNATLVIPDGVTLTVSDNKTLELANPAFLDSQGSIAVAAGGTLKIPAAGGATEAFVGADGNARICLTSGTLTFDMGEDLLTLGADAVAEIPENQEAWLLQSTDGTTKTPLGAVIETGAELTVNGTLNVISGTDQSGSTLTVKGTLDASGGTLAVAKHAEVAVEKGGKVTLNPDSLLFGGILGKADIAAGGSVSVGNEEWIGSSGNVNLTAGRMTLDFGNIASGTIAAALTGNAWATVPAGKYWTLKVGQENAAANVNLTVENGSTLAVAGGFHVANGSQLALGGALNVNDGGHLSIGSAGTIIGSGGITNSGVLTLDKGAEEAVGTLDVGVTVKNDGKVYAMADITDKLTNAVALEDKTYDGKNYDFAWTAEKIIEPVEPEQPITPVTPVVPSGSAGDDDDDGYSISVPASSSIKGGSITVSPRSADKGDTVTITVKPDDGYELDKLTVTDSKGGELKLSTRDGSKYTFTMPASLVNVKVSFRLIETGPVNPFTDVSRSDYYYDAVLWAVENGVTSGTSATTFSPNAPVTRAQAMTFQWRAAGSPAASGGGFDDVAADAYYAGAVTWAVANGITNGTGGNTFSPDSPVTRAQAVTFLWKELA